MRTKIISVKNILIPVGFLLIITGPFSGQSSAQNTKQKNLNPVNDLPSHITRVTHFGQRADWSHDGKRILFLEKTFGDVYEVNVETGVIQPVTHHYHHEGYTRALYLPNGDILLSGARSFDADNPAASRYRDAEMWVLDKSLERPPRALGMKFSEGPAVSRNSTKVAWTIRHANHPDELPEGVSQIWMGDIVQDPGTVRTRLDNIELVLDSRDLPFELRTFETQNFRPGDEEEIIFSAYDYEDTGTEVMGVHLQTGEITNYSQDARGYHEAEGIFPDGKYITVERGDIWKLALDGSAEIERLTYFTEYPGYKATNPAISDDGQFMAFQMARSGDRAGVGYGIFIYNFQIAENKKE